MSGSREKGREPDRCNDGKWDGGGGPEVMERLECISLI